MPRIRKKTSKRGTTHQRAKIKHKVTESRKKAKKEAKKNPQWKSKQKKDPGIPNNFPYKEQILAEVAEQRRQAEEAKQKRKDAKKAVTASATVEEEEPVVIDGVTDVTASASTSSRSQKSNVENATIKEKESESTETLLKNCEMSSLSSVLDNSDVVVYVLDARDPLAFYNRDILEKIKIREQKRLLLIINKIDLAPRESVQEWLNVFRHSSTILPMRSASAFLLEHHISTGKNNQAAPKRSKTDAVGRSVLLQALSAECSRRNVNNLTVAFVGVANTGKSSIINSLLSKSACPTYDLSSASAGPSTTARAQEVSLVHEGKTFRLIDTPALTWNTSTNLDEDAASKLRARDVLLRNRGRIDRVKDPVSAVSQIVSRAKTEDLMVFYTLPAFTQGDSTAFLTALARSQRLIKKGGDPDLQAAARIVLRDWNTNKFPWYTTPQARASEAVGVTDGEDFPDNAELYAHDAESLAAAPTRKDMRKGSGLIKLTPLDIETRTVDMDAVWGEDEGSDEESEEDAIVDEEDEEEEDEDEEEDEEKGSDEDDDEDDEDDEAPQLLPPRSPSPKGKRKRSAQSEAAPRAKKVSFAASSKPQAKKQILSLKTRQPSAPAKRSKPQHRKK